MGSRSPRGNHHRHLCRRYYRHGQVRRLPALGRGGGRELGTAGWLRITGSCHGSTYHRGGPFAPAARMFARAEECLPRGLEDRREAESRLRPGREQGGEEPTPPTPQPPMGRVEGEGGSGSPRPLWLRVPSLRRCRAPPAVRGRAPRCAVAIGPQAASGTRRPRGGDPRAGCGTAGALVPCSVRADDLTRALLQHPLALFFFSCLFHRRLLMAEATHFTCRRTKVGRNENRYFFAVLEVGRGAWTRRADQSMAASSFSSRPAAGHRATAGLCCRFSALVLQNDDRKTVLDELSPARGSPLRCPLRLPPGWARPTALLLLPHVES